ncbi:MAG: TatD family hydrolase [Desulfobacteraceae bacterium]|jgi:TatD DNase family protein
MLIDSHAHLDMDDYKDDLESVIDRAVEGGVERIITIGIDLASSLKALELANRYDFLYSTVGFHPHDADRVSDAHLMELQALAKETRVVAWGEIGLDFFKNQSGREKQIEIFRTQLDIAYETGLPVIIHNRDADKEILEILKASRNSDHKGIIHCFSSDYEAALTFIDMGFHISIPGIVTFKNADKLKEVAARVPVERMLVETDAPFLAPVPKRGKRNEPLFVTYTARMIAELRGMEFEELAAITTANCKNLLNIA